MKLDGAISGKLIRAQDLPKGEVQPGPLPTPKIEDPIDKVINSTLGKFPYEANGVVEWKPENIQFLGS
jgi:hypothetical protein